MSRPNKLNIEIIARSDQTWLNRSDKTKSYDDQSIRLTVFGSSNKVDREKTEEQALSESQTNMKKI